MRRVLIGISLKDGDPHISLLPAIRFGTEYSILLIMDDISYNPCIMRVKGGYLWNLKDVLLFNEALCIFDFPIALQPFSMASRFTNTGKQIT
jgi:hypothetical protein